MSTAALRKVLVPIVQGTPVSSTARGLARSFLHDPDVGDIDKPADARRFYFVADTMSGLGPYTPGAKLNRRLTSLRLVVVYPADVADAVIEDAISGDYDAITARLLDSALWSGTDIVDVVVDTTFLPATIVRDASGITLTITLTVEHMR